MTALMCVVAHPDDETMLCGGTLALLAARGVAVHLACLTRGEGGELGEPPRCTRAELGDVREQEMVCAVGRLGGRSLTFLGYVDPAIAPDGTLSAPPADPAMLAGQVISGIKQFGPQVVLTHGTDGEYGHPAHRLLHLAVKIAVTSLGAQAPALYTFAASYPGHPYPRLANPNDQADWVVDVSAALDRKEAAALCHQTQNALFVRRRSEQAGRQLSVREVLLPEESLRRHWPADSGAADPLPGWLGSAARPPQAGPA